MTTTMITTVTVVLVLPEGDGWAEQGLCRLEGIFDEHWHAVEHVDTLPPEIRARVRYCSWRVGDSRERRQKRYERLEAQPC
jgi:hypothetical protein